MTLTTLLAEKTRLAAGLFHSEMLVGERRDNASSLRPIEHPELHRGIGAMDGKNIGLVLGARGIVYICTKRFAGHVGVLATRIRH